tara:strand:+ start:62 stop:349 length:288 start_codon:yes stop_codon:yes gene_type:complete
MTEIEPKTKHLNPAEYVILVFGGVRPLARRLEIDPSTVSYWRSRKVKGGLGVGEIPRWRWAAILEIAKAERRPVKEKDLLHGRDMKFEYAMKIPK